MDRSEQIVRTLIRLLLEEQSDQGLHCLQFLFKKPPWLSYNYSPCKLGTIGMISGLSGLLDETSNPISV